VRGAIHSQQLPIDAQQVSHTSIDPLSPISLERVSRSIKLVVPRVHMGIGGKCVWGNNKGCSDADFAAIFDFISSPFAYVDGFFLPGISHLKLFCGILHDEEHNAADEESQYRNDTSNSGDAA
jgi:hypothetical protein